MRRSFVAGLVVLVAVSSFAGVVAAQPQSPPSDYGGSPSLDAYAPSPTVSPGDRGPFTVQVANDGEVTEGIPPARGAVTTARNVRVAVDADG
ncbi:exo-alpha-sialidase, partial [Halobacteriales archaeon SW_12_69_24]